MAFHPQTTLMEKCVQLLELLKILWADRTVGSRLSISVEPAIEPGENPEDR